MPVIEIKVPDIGDFAEVTVIELIVKPGDTVRAEQSLLTVESDKASMEIPSSHAGVVKEIRVQLGDKVKQGSLVLMLEVAGAAASPAAAAAVARPHLPVRLSGCDHSNRLLQPGACRHLRRGAPRDRRPRVGPVRQPGHRTNSDTNVEPISRTGIPVQRQTHPRRGTGHRCHARNAVDGATR